MKKREGLEACFLKVLSPEFSALELKPARRLLLSEQQRLQEFVPLQESFLLRAAARRIFSVLLLHLLHDVVESVSCATERTYCTIDCCPSRLCLPVAWTLAAAVEQIYVF